MHNGSSSEESGGSTVFTLYLSEGLQYGDTQTIVLIISSGLNKGIFEVLELLTRTSSYIFIHPHLLHLLFL